jgi:hypothetical protein
MQKAGLTLTRIYKELSILPEKQLNEVKDFVEFISSKNQVKKRTVVHLNGIWEGKGFEKLNISKEIKSIKEEISKSILKRAT